MAQPNGNGFKRWIIGSAIGAIIFIMANTGTLIYHMGIIKSDLRHIDGTIEDIRRDNRELRERLWQLERERASRTAVLLRWQTEVL